MGTLNYLKHDGKKQLFELGKGLHLSELTLTQAGLEASILQALEDGFYKEDLDKPSWAKSISADVLATIGLTDLTSVSDQEDALFDEFGSYTIVGTVYAEKDDVGKTYIESLQLG